MTPDATALLPIVKEHLNETGGTHDPELIRFTTYAQQAFELLPLKAPFATLDLTANPLLQYALLETIRDMWKGQAGAAARTFGADTEAQAYGLGRKALPPYILSLLADMLGDVVATSPTGRFPEPQGWPDAAATRVWPTL